MPPIRMSRESSFVVHKDKFDRIIGFNLSPEDVSELNISSNVPSRQPVGDKTCTHKIPTCAEEITVSKIPSLIILSGEDGVDGKKSLIYYKAEQEDIEEAIKEKDDETDCPNFFPDDGSYKGSAICGKCALVVSCYNGNLTM